MFEIRLYSHDNIKCWNEFVAKSKNSTFLFNRDYMDYHSDRFIDASLLIYRKNKLYALFPANINIEKGTVYSHQGLTYGGIILDKNATTSEVMEVFGLIFQHYKKEGCNSMIYKPLPYIYCQMPAQEDLYSLFRFDAKLIGRNISSTIIQANKIGFVESRKSGIRKAKNNGLIIAQSDDYSSYWNILNDNLGKRYGVRPVHSIEEIILLKNKFPDNIKHHVAIFDDKVIAGCVMYLSYPVAHVQYISANEEGKNIGALDLLFDELINNVYSHFPIFDFGQSSEQMGLYLNENLIFQKEGFGGRGVVYDTYEIIIPEV